MINMHKIIDKACRIKAASSPSSAIKASLATSAGLAAMAVGEQLDRKRRKDYYTKGKPYEENIYIKAKEKIKANVDPWT